MRRGVGRCHLMSCDCHSWATVAAVTLGGKKNKKNKTGQGFNMQLRGPGGEFTEGAIKEMILITGEGEGGWLCIAGYVIELCVNQ